MKKILTGEKNIETISREETSLERKIVFTSSKDTNLELGGRRVESPLFIEMEDKKIEKEQREMKRKIFGYELVLDLYDCDLKVISSRQKLQEYVNKLCRLIKMKRFGDAIIPYFGEHAPHTKGYSLVQLIETSSISGHFSESWKRAYINIFSCKDYNHRLALEFTKKFFGAKRVKSRLLVR